jgi:class 3 adenylate cyclase
MISEKSKMIRGQTAPAINLFYPKSLKSVLRNVAVMCVAAIMAVRILLFAIVGIGRTIWGAGAFVMNGAPSRSSDDAFYRWLRRLERYSFAPENALAFAQASSQADVRNVMPDVSEPTLVVQRQTNSYRADNISGTRNSEESGSDHLPYVVDQDANSGQDEEFLAGVRSIAEPQRVLATILFTDIVESTRHAHNMGDKAWKTVMDSHDSFCEFCVERFCGRIVKRTGDGIHATFDGPGRAISCARKIIDSGHELGIHIRAGLHTGECEIRGEETEGVAVHLASRISSLANSDEVLVSRTVRDLVAGSGLGFADRGTHKMRGFPDDWQLFSVI